MLLCLFINVVEYVLNSTEVVHSDTGVATFLESPHNIVPKVIFSIFEHTVNFLYKKLIHKRREECSRAQQLSVTCLAGYAAGSVGSIFSNPADDIVASLNNRKARSLKLAVKKIGFLNLFTRSLPIRTMLVGPVKICSGCSMTPLKY